ncbi:MAG: hypothetical protein L6Q75_03695 [Burkholderiaceae bacterium]|nr:hypothetical protein [Burkholderiaceae bacterium]
MPCLPDPPHRPGRLPRLGAPARRWACALALAAPLGSGQALDLADAPLFATSTAPGNLLLALSVEWPTATTPAYFSTTAYSAASTFVGYFDPDKCYRYVHNLLAPADSYFTPHGPASSHACTSTALVPLWSGNWLNWASTHTLDAFRWVLTGGTRKTDSTSSTVLQKTFHDGSGGSGWFPNKTSSSGVSGATPFNWASVNTRVYGGGYRIWVTGTADLDSATPPAGTLAYTGQNSYSLLSFASAGSVYELYVQVKVCDSSIGIESNCQLYPNGQYKPEGLIQKYSQRLRFSAFGYLNDGASTRDGGVMRARMKYVAPTKPVPGSSAIANTATEWDATTGVMATNPDAADATATAAYVLAQTGQTVTVGNSGVMNYLNKFGQFATGTRYKSLDPVGELYYAGLRYYRNLGNVPEYSQLATAGSAGQVADWVDGFPVVTSWDDPIAYTCQKNFILGIGDVNAWNDANLHGSTIRGTEEATMPALVAADTLTDVRTATDMVGTLEGITGLGSTLMSSGRQNTYFMAGLAYDAHTRDQRSDLTGSQTVSTYWVDVMEGQSYLSKNQYWLAAKYGGFTVPSGFAPYAASNGSSTLPSSAWSTSGDTIGSDLRPDNYFSGGQADDIRDGLSKAFARIAAEAYAATSTAFSSVSPNEASAGNLSYAAGYDPQTWSGALIGSTVAYATDGSPTLTAVWDAAALLDATAATSRRIVTCCAR